MTRTAILLLTLACFVVAVGCGEGAAPPEWVDPDKVKLQEKIDAGKNLFMGNCVSCHVIGEEPVVREGPDLTYFGAKAKRSGYALNLLDPAQPAPKAKPDHPKVPDYKQRSAVALFLSQECKPRNYARPGSDVPRGRQTTCAVTGVLIDMQDARTERRTHGGKPYYLYDAMAARKFDLNPGHFAK